MTNSVNGDALTALVAAMRAIAADNRTCPEVPCQCDRAWHADTYEGWADIIEAALLAAGRSAATTEQEPMNVKEAGSLSEAN